VLRYAFSKRLYEDLFDDASRNKKIIRDQCMILRQKLEYVDLERDVKILCKTQQSILYMGSGMIAKQALLKHEYS
jgi:hypothetical protein